MSLFPSQFSTEATEARSRIAKAVAAGLVLCTKKQPSAAELVKGFREHNALSNRDDRGLARQT